MEVSGGGWERSWDRETKRASYSRLKHCENVDEAASLINGEIWLRSCGAIPRQHI